MVWTLPLRHLFLYASLKWRETYLKIVLSPLLALHSQGNISVAPMVLTISSMQVCSKYTPFKEILPKQCLISNCWGASHTSSSTYAHFLSLPHPPYSPLSCPSPFIPNQHLPCSRTQSKSLSSSPRGLYHLPLPLLSSQWNHQVLLTPTLPHQHNPFSLVFIAIGLTLSLILSARSGLWYHSWASSLNITASVNNYPINGILSLCSHNSLSIVTCTHFCLPQIRVHLLRTHSLSPACIEAIYRSKANLLWKCTIGLIFTSPQYKPWCGTEQALKCLERKRKAGQREEQMESHVSLWTLKVFLIITTFSNELSIF